MVGGGRLIIGRCQKKEQEGIIEKNAQVVVEITAALCTVPASWTEKKE